MKLTRPPARIADQGTFPLPGIPGASYTIGRDAVLDHVWAPGQVNSVDIETSGFERKRYDIKAVTIGNMNHSLILDPRDPAQFQMARKILNSGAPLTFHNSPYDVQPLHAVGLVDRATVENVWDTLLWARLANPNEKVSKKLTACANTYLGLDLVDPMSAMLKVLGISISTWFEEFDLDSPAYRIMAATDTILTARLQPVVRQAAFDRLTKGHPFTTYGLSADEAWTEVDKPQVVNRVTLDRACKGFLVDPDYLDTYRDQTGAVLRQQGAELEELGIKPTNSASLTEWLDGQGLIHPNYPRTPKEKRPSGKADDLETLQHPIAKTFLEHKKATKLDDDYLSKVNDVAIDGRIYPAANIMLARTGRMSYSGDAPVHQFPGPARGILLADNREEARRTMAHPLYLEDGKTAHPCTCSEPKGLVSIDWSQIEPVVAANIAGDVEVLAGYEDGTSDLYSAVSEAADRPRKAAKTALLAQLYGQGRKSLAVRMQMSVNEVDDVIDAVWGPLPKTKEMFNTHWSSPGLVARIANEYETVFTVSGRIIPIPGNWWPCFFNHDSQSEINACRKCNERGMVFKVPVHIAVNSMVQGSAYDILAESVVALHEAGLSDAVYLLMHDEIVCDAEAAHDIRKIMETPPERLVMMAGRTPVLRTDMAHLGERWAAA